MERRFQVRLEELVGDAQMDAAVLRDILPELERFLEPFIGQLETNAQQRNARNYVTGLLSNLEDKNVEAIAYMHDRERQGLQKFIGQSPWDYRPLTTTLAQQVGRELGEEDGVLVFDPSAFPKKGTESVGVQRQWCGRLGKVDNCQVGVYLGYVSRKEHALVDFRLYLPEDWATDRKRRKKAGVPRESRFRTRHELALEMLDEKGPLLPHRWVAGDDEMGRSSRFRQALREREERYLLAVPSNTLIRDLEADPPPYSGRGPRPHVPFVRVDRWLTALPDDVWTTIDVRDGEKGPLVVQMLKRRVQAKTERRRAGPEETLVVFRERQGTDTWKHDYLLSSAPLATPLPEFARVFKAEHRIEECLQRAKGQAGLADYEVRTWEGWHHHQALSLIATWFLTQETRRGKNTHARADAFPAALGYRLANPPASGCRPSIPHSANHDPSAGTHRRSSLLSLEKT
jgi:SRSO17 transposase